MYFLVNPSSRRHDGMDSWMTGETAKINSGKNLWENTTAADNSGFTIVTNKELWMNIVTGKDSRGSIVTGRSSTMRGSVVVEMHPILCIGY